MYEKFYQLTERPFSLLPDPDFLYLSDKHSTGLDMLQLAVFNHSGFCVVSGEIGAGKTTLIRELLNRLDASICTGLVSNTHASFGVLMQWIMAAFELPCDTDDRVELHRQFIDFVIQQYAAGKHTLLIIDEAQNLSTDAMEELRMLSNVNTEKDLVLQVILVGQSELQQKLQQPELRQFLQRIAINYHLTGLSREETTAYIRHRVTHAGGSASLFDDSACNAVYHYTGGIPRLINRICDLGLVYGYSEDSPVINAALISAVAGEHWPGEFPELPDEIKHPRKPQTAVGDSDDFRGPVPPRSIDSAEDDGLQADLRPARQRSVVQASGELDVPLSAHTLREPVGELKHWQSPLDDVAPPPRKRGKVLAILGLTLIAIGSVSGLLWLKQDGRLVSSGNPERLAPDKQEAEPELEQRLEQDRLIRQREEAERVAREQELARQQEVERVAREQELARQQEAERVAREQELARQREAERVAREQELARQQEAEQVAREQELARQREAERVAREQELVRQREVARLEHEQELARQREAERKKRELAREKEAEQRERQRFALEERRRADELRREKQRRDRLADEARRRAAARAALEQMSNEISWAEE